MGNMGMFCVGLLVGAIIFYFLSKNQFAKIKNHNEEIAKQESDLKISVGRLSEQKSALSKNIEEAHKQYNILQQQIEQIKTNAQDYYDTSYTLAKEKFDKAKEKLEEEYKEAREDYNKIYLELLEDSSRVLHERIEELTAELAVVTAQLQEKEELVSAAVDAAIREQEIKDNANFYKLVLSDEDLEEIKVLRQVIPQLRNKEVLNKLIWKTYYEKPYTDLIGRVVGPNTRCGIYKITNLQNQMCYVGQSVDIANRWKQHIKRGLGAETATRNKLYPAMQKIGPENFRFEIIEDCDRALLDQREDYWQDYFRAIDFGYSIK